jgi:hypothetical protein
MKHGEVSAPIPLFSISLVRVKALSHSSFGRRRDTSLLEASRIARASLEQSLLYFFTSFALMRQKSL